MRNRNACMGEGEQEAKDGPWSKFLYAHSMESSAWSQPWGSCVVGLTDMTMTDPLDQWGPWFWHQKSVTLGLLSELKAHLPDKVCLTHTEECSCYVCWAQYVPRNSMLVKTDPESKSRRPKSPNPITCTSRPQLLDPIGWPLNRLSIIYINLLVFELQIYWIMLCVCIWLLGLCIRP